MSDEDAKKSDSSAKGETDSEEIASLTGKLARKIWDTAYKELKNVFRPGRIKDFTAALAEARYQFKIMAVQANVDAKAIEDGTKRIVNGQLVDVKPRAEDQALTRPSNREVISFLATDTLFQNLNQFVNFEKIVSMAEEEAASVADEKVSDEPVDELWFTRWRKGAEDVSQEDLQRLWAKVLAGESIKPGSYSLRTLHFLSTMSRAEAELIARLAPFVIKDMIVREAVSELGSKGLAFPEFLKLEDLGVISGVNGLLSGVLNFFPFEDKLIWFYEYKDGYALLFESKEPKTLDLGCYIVTGIGLEVLTLGDFSANIDYLRAVGKIAQKSNIKMRYGKIKVTGPTTRKLVNEIKLNDIE
ncbi:MAG: DUF2806 domain-containing protein [Rhodospirillales bacterium]|nr:DUF2806 domain-containing protein [Rhodospirillales bacterium]